MPPNGSAVAFRRGPHSWVAMYRTRSHERRRNPMAASRTPIAVANGQRRIGEDLATWRHLRRLTAAQVADRAGISRYNVMRLENGEGATMENLLRVARALGVLDQLVEAVDPFQTDVGRLRSQEALPQRVRPPRPGSTARSA